MSHPLENFLLRFRNFKGFADDPGEWISFRPITVLVGRNNSGKSAIIDGLRVILTKGSSFKPYYHRAGASSAIDIDSALTKKDIARVFPQNTSGGGVPGNHWEFGQKFIGTRVVRSYNPKWNATWISGPDLDRVDSRVRQEYQTKLAEAAEIPTGSIFHISAERNVQPEPENAPTPVQPNGDGLTNLIRAFLHDSRYSMEEVENGLRSDLNDIYLGDTQFTRILCQLHPEGKWEIYLSDSSGATVRLSQSGSSLKSIFIILATIRLNPIIARETSIENNVFCVEEPENNLHPALLRRLLGFLAASRDHSKSSLVITTHSSAAIDWATRREDCATYHIQRYANGARATEAKEYLAVRNLIQDLDIRASEILQANGVIWVEGPSDRIYIRRWIDVFSNGQLQEGIHYSIMFYGGKLLSHLSSLPPNEVGDAISLLRLNRNVVVVIDSDRRRLKGGRFRADLNSTKKRIISECNDNGGYAWITEGREIENYLSRRIITLISSGKVNHVDKYESVPSEISDYVGDKISLAHDSAQNTGYDDLDVLDLQKQLSVVINRIRRWNSLSD